MKGAGSGPSGSRATASAAPHRASSRPAGALLAAGALVYLLAIAVASAHPGPGGWGLHMAAFLPPTSLLLVAGLLVTGVTLLGWSALEERRPETAPREVGSHKSVKAGGSGVMLTLLILYAGILWTLRSRSYFLGDQWVWLDNIQAGHRPLFSEPLGATVWYRFADLLRAIHAPLEPTVLGLLSVLCGIVAAILAWGIAGQLAGSRVKRVATLILLLTLGTMQLYCGHIESYPIVSVFVLLYLYLGLKLAREDVSPVLVGLSLGVAISSHILLLYLAPSYLLLISRVRSSKIARAGLIALPFAMAAGALFALGFRPRNLAVPFEILYASMSAGGGPHSGRLSALLSWVSQDFANLILLVMPVPALLLLTQLATRSWSLWDARAGKRFLAAAAAAGLFALVVLSLGGTPAQDWDILAITILPLAVLGVDAGQTLDTGMGSPIGRVGLSALSIGSALAFVLVNASEAAGVRRFQVLISEAAPLKPHERAFGNEKLVKYHAAHEEYEPMLRHALRALAADSAVVRYWANVGSALYSLERYPDAEHFYQEAIRRGCRKGPVHYNLGMCYVIQERYEEAAGQFWLAIQIDGARAVEAVMIGCREGPVFYYLGVRHTAIGRYREAAALFRRAIQIDGEIPVYRSELERALGSARN